MAKARATTLMNDVLGKRSHELKEKTPTWSHVVQGTRYNAVLAKRQLLGNSKLPSVVTLIDEIEALSDEVRCMSDAAALSDNETLMQADGVLAAAKVSLSVIAAVGVIEGKDADRTSQAEVLLADKDAGLPAILRTKLQGIVAAAA